MSGLFIPSMFHAEYQQKVPTAPVPNQSAVIPLEPRFNAAAKPGGEQVTARVASLRTPERLLRQSVSEPDQANQVQLPMFAGFGLNAELWEPITAEFPMKHTEGRGEILGFELDSQDVDGSNRYLVGSLSPKAGEKGVDGELKPTSMLSDFLRESYLASGALQRAE